MKDMIVLDEAVSKGIINESQSNTNFEPTY